MTAFAAFVVAHYLEVTEDFAVLEEQVSVLGGRSAGARSPRSFRRPSLRARALFEHCVRALDSSLAIVRMACVIRRRRLERRHESSRAAGHGESVWLGWFPARRAAQVRADRRTARPVGRGRRLRKHASRCNRRSRARPGTVTGTGAVILTTARPWSVVSDECRIDSIARRGR